MKRSRIIWLMIFLLGRSVYAQPGQLNLTLEQAETNTLQFSHRLQSKKTELLAAQSRLDTQTSLVWPRLSLEASWRYVSIVPEISVLPGRPGIPLGDHTNYSVGPMLSWNFIDSGGIYFNYRAAESAFAAKQAEYSALERQTKLQTRLTYFQTQLTLAQSHLIADALKLSQAQYRDIQSQYRAGQASRIDLLSSHQDTLNNLRQLKQARTDLLAALRELLALTGDEQPYDLSSPAEAGQTLTAFRPAEAPSTLINLDPLEKSLARLSPAAQAQPDEQLPQIQVFLKIAESNRYLAQNLSVNHWPKIQASAKTSLDYPNGPILETIHQNTLAVNGSWSIWEGGRIVNQSAEQNNTALANEQQSQQSHQDLKLSWNKSQDLFTQYQALQTIDAEAIRETEELEKLVYQAYRAGRAGFLEVQSANYRALAAKIQAVRTQVQMLIQLATLDSLAEAKEKSQ